MAIRTAVVRASPGTCSTQILIAVAPSMMAAICSAAQNRHRGINSPIAPVSPASYPYVANYCRSCQVNAT